ncbi:hypothetical protein GCM10011409_22870 [Lentibacillus populi]|uniref:DUF4871 domain-containing protein n=1 Tax=Lentibacillus populi TaxID=1827502 RepID=A0A9W5TY52_9BACI|nr:hypothetical protein [Lentibacillus populi]GGB44709.1 hypothetical protein GCM10011409_22870 [Lentibacillus populi]
MIKKIPLFLLLVVVLATEGCANINDKTNDITIDNGKSDHKDQNWKESPLFESNGYTMIGEKGRIGFIYDDSETTRFYPNKKNKYMFHVWGKDKELDGSFEVIATHEDDDKKITILNESLAGPNNGADRHLPTTLSLPKSGMWRLDAYIGNQLFGSIFVKVYNNEH